MLANRCPKAPRGLRRPFEHSQRPRSLPKLATIHRTRIGAEQVHSVATQQQASPVLLTTRLLVRTATSNELVVVALVTLLGAVDALWPLSGTLDLTRAADGGGVSELGSWRVVGQTAGSSQVVTHQPVHEMKWCFDMVSGWAPVRELRLSVAAVEDMDLMLATMLGMVLGMLVSESEWVGEREKGEWGRRGLVDSQSQKHYRMCRWLGVSACVR